MYFRSRNADAACMLRNRNVDTGMRFRSRNADAVMHVRNRNVDTGMRFRSRNADTGIIILENKRGNKE